MITYIYHKDSTLWAFEGPEEPKYCADFGDIVLICGNTFCRCDSQLKGHIAAMSTSRESALPVVNGESVLKKHNSDWYKVVEQGIIEKLKPGEPVALPGWGLEKIKQGTAYFEREAYRLVRSEPEDKRKKSNTLVGDDLLKQFVNKQINLTFYSGKLWHSDKPFPSITRMEYEQYPELIKPWLSTAYEVVNQEVIPQIKIMVEGDRKCLHFNNGVHSLRELNDGDQIPLPEGYGTKWDTVNPCREVRKCLNERPDGDTCNQFNGAVCQRVHTVAVITQPEKPDNRAHGYTEGYVESPRERIERAMIAMKLAEPSESQEETQRDVWNEAIDACAKIVWKYRNDPHASVAEVNDELQKLRK